MNCNLKLGVLHQFCSQPVAELLLALHDSCSADYTHCATNPVGTDRFSSLHIQQSPAVITLHSHKTPWPSAWVPGTIFFEVC